MSGSDPSVEKTVFTPAVIGALAHLYRGEVYRSTVWRNRLDATTNWAVVTTGIALSATFASVDASPLPMVLVGLLVVVFLIFEARRYRYFDVWRMRVRVMETQFFGPMLRGQGVSVENGWPELLADDYRGLHFHISVAEALGRRLRRNYSWILAIQAIAYYGKLAIHPVPVVTFADLWERAAIGPLPGEIVVLMGLLFHGGWATFAVVTLRNQRAVGRVHKPLPGTDRMKVILGEES
ncbi:MAG: DUF2270 domain-containing protein [Rhodospirillales bacterium]|nr:DUF2270 domain-containing protein [Rhodospirillales bacterium]